MPTDTEITLAQDRKEIHTTAQVATIILIYALFIQKKKLHTWISILIEQLKERNSFCANEITLNT